MISISHATNQQDWDTFLFSQVYRPFLQSWTMGEVYEQVGQKPLRIEAREDGKIVGICFAHLVPARRGRHYAVPYGPVIAKEDALFPLLQELSRIAKEQGCSFVRLSPFLPLQTSTEVMTTLHAMKAKQSPLHLLAEHIWYLPLRQPDSWALPSPAHPFDQLRAGGRGAGLPAEALAKAGGEGPILPDDLFAKMRSTTRNLVRRAQKEGVEVTASADPEKDLEHFLKLHDETRKRHGFTPYTNTFFRAQVAAFAPRKECTLYLARYQGEVIASSIHMHMGGETSYHHGASTHKYRNIPASYLLQWTAIQDAIKRGDHVYNFWGIAPLQTEFLQATSYKLQADRHPFAGVTLFKTGFGGALLELMHCTDIPLSVRYHGTRLFEMVRKWKRGF